MLPAHFRSMSEYALAIIGIAGAAQYGVGTNSLEGLAFRADPLATKKVRRGGAILDLLGLPVEFVKMAPRLSLSGEAGAVDLHGYVTWWVARGAKAEWV